ncbi:recombinase family protein [Clostridium novyi]|uniref:recombinase family protein n=1 Tax=Clostridium novyi TaxID=1542 RepID=UPI000A69D0D5
MERNTIIERTQAGKAIAKTKPGFKEGRPKKYTKEQIDHALNLLESNSYSYVERITCISKSTLIRAVRDKKYNLFYINIL